MLTLKDVKTALRVDGDYDDGLLTAHMAAAKAAVKAAVTNFDLYYDNDDDFTALADCTMKVMIMEMYDNPMQGHDGAADYSYPVRSMITQLQFWGDSNDN